MSLHLQALVFQCYSRIVVQRQFQSYCSLTTLRSVENWILGNQCISVSCFSAAESFQRGRSAPLWAVISRFRAKWFEPPLDIRLQTACTGSDLVIDRYDFTRYDIKLCMSLGALRSSWSVASRSVCRDLKMSNFERHS